MMKEYLLKGLCCAKCARKIENAAKALDGVEAARVDAQRATLTLQIQSDSPSLLETVRRMVEAIEESIQVSEQPETGVRSNA